MPYCKNPAARDTARTIHRIKTTLNNTQHLTKDLEHYIRETHRRHIPPQQTAQLTAIKETINQTLWHLEQLEHATQNHKKKIND